MFTLLKKLGKLFLDFIQTIVLALAIFLVVYLFLFQPHQVSGQSMMPNFQDGEYLLTDKVTYRFKLPQRGDVIVFNAPPHRQDEYIKRIIGLPGETVSIQNRHLYINRRPLNETYIPTQLSTPTGNFLPEGSSYTLKSDEYFVVGDNRLNSSDSRIWGPIKRSDIVGKAWLIYWPLPQAGLVPQTNYL